MDLLCIWYDYRCRSKILFSTIHTPAHDLEVMVTDLVIYVQVLRQSFEDLLILYPLMDLLYIWKDYRYRSKVLFSSIPTPAYNLEVVVTGLKIILKFCFKDF